MSIDLINNLTNIKNKQFYLLALVFSAGALLSVYLPLAIIIILSYSFVVKKYGKEVILYTVVFLYFVVTSDFNEKLRLILNYGGLAALAAVFVWEFGISFKSIHRVPKKVLALVGITLLSMIISTAGSADPSKSSMFLIKQVIFFLIVFVLYSFTRKDEDIFSWIKLFIITSTTLALSLIYETLGMLLSASSLVELGVIRTSGLYGNANAVALFFVISIPIMAVMMLEKRGDKRVFRVYAALLIINFLALVLTNSRASLMGVMVSIFYLLFHFKKELFYKTIYSGLFVLFVILMIDPLRDFFLTVIRYERIFENIRGYYWQIGLDVFTHNPLFGVGPGMFEDNIYRFLPVRMNTFEEFQLFWARSGTAHNFFLYRLSEYGIIGIFNAIFFVGIIFNISSKVLREIGIKNKYYYIVLGIRGMSYGLMLRALLETTGLLTNGWITRDLPFWLAFIILIYIYEQTSKPERARL